jgi:peptidylprolyl isomerase
MKTVTNGSTVMVHYKGTLNDGSVFDDSKIRGSAIEVTMGTGRVIPGFESALMGMTEGQSKSVTITAADAYGQTNPEAIQTVPKEAFPPDFEPNPGETVQGTSQNGQPLMARVLSHDPAGVTLDFNHPLAGEDLTFDLEVLGITDSDTTEDTDAATNTEE